MIEEIKQRLVEFSQLTNTASGNAIFVFPFCHVEQKHKLFELA